jgi:hypothetical protein
MGTKRGWALALRRGRRDWKRLIVPTTFTYGSALAFGIIIHGIRAYREMVGELMNGRLMYLADVVGYC